MNLSIFPSSTVDCRPGTGDILLIILSSLNHNIDLSTYPPSNCATSPKRSRCWFWVEALVDLTATLLAPEKDPQNALFQFWIQLGRNVFLSRKPWFPILQRNGKTDRKPDIPSRLRNSSNGKVATEIWIIAFHSISLHAATSAHVAAQVLVVKLHPPAGQNLDPTGPSTESVAAYDAGTCITVRDKRDNFKFELEHVYDVEEIRHTLQIRQIKYAIHIAQDDEITQTRTMNGAAMECRQQNHDAWMNECIIKLTNECMNEGRKDGRKEGLIDWLIE